MPDIGRLLVVLGIVLLVVGGLFVFLPRIGINLGRLPGDFQFGNGQTTCLVPIATSIILSILLTIILNLIGRFFR
jgi:hypothetical protein